MEDRPAAEQICHYRMETLIAHDNTRPGRSDTVVSTLNSDRDNKIIICTADKYRQEAVLSTLPLICNIKLSKDDEQSGCLQDKNQVPQVSPAWSCSTCGLASVKANS